MKPIAISPAGVKMLQNYLQLEAGLKPQGRYPDFYSTILVDVQVSGQPAKGMLLGAGDGGAKATATRLEKDGLAILRWNNERILVITDAGRAAMAELNPGAAPSVD
ncbi:hypothetical protein G3A43_07015 [Paraburkholderia aspalathi]|nr:hypothetical protein [Paraburkholderia aspalathi]MBK3780002.1 hypothetical protein [Paraburkholderia aspalathi]